MKIKVIMSIKKGLRPIELSQRQEQIIEIVKSEGPITGEHIAEKNQFNFVLHYVLTWLYSRCLVL